MFKKIRGKAIFRSRNYIYTINMLLFFNSRNIREINFLKTQIFSVNGKVLYISTNYSNLYKNHLNILCIMMINMKGRVFLRQLLE